MALFDHTAARLARGPSVLFPADPANAMAEAILRYDPNAGCLLDPRTGSAPGTGPWKTTANRGEGTQSTMTELTGFEHGDDVAGAIDRAERTVSAMQDLKRQLAGLTGTGEAAAGQVRVTWAAAVGLDRIWIDPKAMRLGSQALAEAVGTAIRAAIADLQRQTAEMIGEKVGAGSPEDPMAIATAARDAFDRRMDAIIGQVDVARRMAKRLYER